METQKTPNTSDKLKKEQSWRNQAFWFQTILDYRLIPDWSQTTKPQ